MLRGHLLPLWVVLALVLTAGAPRATAAQEASPAAVPAALPSLLEEWLAAFNAGDPDQLLALIADDGLWEEPAIGLAARGPDAIRAHL
jgi:ketosteroid isomerase-like protein